jgi:2-polyprenyl-3-methyl-5-hydroxy-6-metoxy-1,4-benzoquinol methylase
MESSTTSSRKSIKLDWSGPIEHAHETEMDKYTKFSKAQLE